MSFLHTESHFFPHVIKLSHTHNYSLTYSAPSVHSFCLTHIIQIQTHTTFLTHAHYYFSFIHAALSNSIQHTIIYFERIIILAHTHYYSLTHMHTSRGTSVHVLDYDKVRERKYDLWQKRPLTMWMQWFKVSHTTSTSLIVHALIQSHSNFIYLPEREEHTLHHCLPTFLGWPDNQVE